jgi:hypothetical protein
MGTVTSRHRKAARLTISLASRDYDALAGIAERDGASLAWVIRRAISRFLKEQADGDVGQRSMSSGVSQGRTP